MEDDKNRFRTKKHLPILDVHCVVCRWSVAMTSKENDVACMLKKLFDVYDEWRLKVNIKVEYLFIRKETMISAYHMIMWNYQRSIITKYGSVKETIGRWLRFM